MNGNGLKSDVKKYINNLQLGFLFFFFFFEFLSYHIQKVDQNCFDNGNKTQQLVN